MVLYVFCLRIDIYKHNLNYNVDNFLFTINCYYVSTSVKL